jgi:hypothetical protein
LTADLRSSLANAKGGPAVIRESADNYGLKQGDRILRMLTEYGEAGVDATTLATGMHELTTKQVREYLHRMVKVEGGPVEEVSTGQYRRRNA